MLLLSWNPSNLLKNDSIKRVVFLQTDHPDDPSKCQDAVKNHRADVYSYRTGEWRVGEIFPCTCQPEMMANFLWAGETLIVSSWTERNLHCVFLCVFASNSRKLYTYVRSEDDLNICEVRCSPDAVLSQQKKSSAGLSEKTVSSHKYYSLLCRLNEYWGSF